VERRCSGTAAITSTLFQFVSVIALGFYWVRKRLTSFFLFLERAPRGLGESLPVKEGQGSDANGDRGVYYFYAAE